MILKVDTYIPNSFWCYNYKRFGHHKKCGEDGSDYPESICGQLKCTKCNGDNLADSRLTKAWKRGNEN